MTTSTHTDEYRALTETLRKARRNAGLTQQQLADRLGKPQSYLAKVEGGERRIDVIEFIALAKALGDTPSTLFETLLIAIKSN